MNNEVRVVAREKCRRVGPKGNESHLTHLAERQDKAKAIDSQENEDKTVCYPSLLEPHLPDLVFIKI